MNAAKCFTLNCVYIVYACVLARNTEDIAEINIRSENVILTTEPNSESENFDSFEDYVTNSETSLRNNVDSLKSFYSIKTFAREADHHRVESTASHTTSAPSGFESLLGPNGSALTEKSSISDRCSENTSFSSNDDINDKPDWTEKESYKTNMIDASLYKQLEELIADNRIWNSVDRYLIFFLAFFKTKDESFPRHENVTTTPTHKYSCPFRCLKGGFSHNFNYETGQVSHYCRYCKCEKQTCEAYDMCCPDDSEPYLNQSKSLLNLNESVSNFTSGKERFRINCEPGQTMMIRSCQPRIQSNMTVVELCESDRLINVETVTAVFDNVTKVAYQNKFCAQCNNATQ
ncbi:hypothetical protein BgiMline_006604, partial [Biomphalaria glabrata]